MLTAKIIHKLARKNPKCLILATGSVTAVLTVAAMVFSLEKVYEFGLLWFFEQSTGMLKTVVSKPSNGSGSGSVDIAVGIKPPVK